MWDETPANIQGIINAIGFPPDDYAITQIFSEDGAQKLGIAIGRWETDKLGEQPSVAQIQAHMDGTASLSISTNKSQIQMDGIDAATITVTASDNTYAGKIWFAVQFPEGNIEEVADNFVAGAALLTLTSEQYGVHRITAIAPGYGQASLEIEGV